MKSYSITLHEGNTYKYHSRMRGISGLSNTTHPEGLDHQVVDSDSDLQWEERYCLLSSQVNFGEVYAQLSLHISLESSLLGKYVSR